MSILSKTLKKVGKSKITRGLGKAIDFGSDFLPPGFRDVGNLSGKLLSGKNLKKSLIGTGLDYAGGRLAKGLGSKLQGIGGGKLRGLLGTGGASGVAIPRPDVSLITGEAGNAIADRIGGGAASALSSRGFAVGGGLGGFVSGAAGALGGGGDWKSKLLGGVSDFVKGGKSGGINLGSLAKYALPALGAYQASKSAGKADKYRQMGLKGVEAEYEAQRPLREMGLAGLSDPRMADVSSLFNRPRTQYRRIG